MSPINYRASIYHWDFYALLGF
ncbi:hypothetical protein [Enterococcus faecium]|nr:hypothetical protein ISU53_13680 [Enterococcus faecium]HAP9334471.1 hypothetical protein [Enterococcus faecium]HAP9348546.1 hypothetical protein [Enterococcus faecium]HAQ7748879.1 hypothetical protein [Enterococcus faecium]HBN1286533.1 hypothetical protein [Enterococcus faecium]